MQSSRILVTGSSQLPEEHKGFASDLGARLIAETSSVLVTGGLVSTGEGPLLAVDGLVANAALAAARDDVAARSRIITMLPESDVSGFQRIQAGTVVRVAYSEPRTRRYSMVLTSDAVVGICGGKATREVLDLAYIAGKPLIPVPSTGGASLECWKRYGEELRQRLALTPDEVRALEDERVPSRGVKACLSVLERVVRPRCFVAMSFASHPVANVFETIEGVVEERGYQVVRIDRANFNGHRRSHGASSERVLRDGHRPRAEQADGPHRLQPNGERPGRHPVRRQGAAHPAVRDHSNAPHAPHQRSARPRRSRRATCLVNAPK
jgi:predicted Rossmann-fold nucleotide-binding protein